MERERYQPTPEEIRTAEEYLTEEQLRLSDERERALEKSQPGSFNSALGTLLQRVDSRLLKLDRIEAYSDLHDFTVKPEFHVTILNNRTGKTITEKLRLLPIVERNKKVQGIKKLISETDWTFDDADSQILKVTKDYVTKNNDGEELRREHRESLIQQISIAGVNKFIERLNELLNTTIEVPPTHITLSSKSDDPRNQTRGIGIESQAEFEAVHPTMIDLDHEHTDG